MSFEEHTKPGNLLKYSFFWNQLRLVVAAISLFFGMPIVYKLMSSSGSLILGLLNIAMLISGAAAFYLLYRWNKGGRTLWGGSDRMDLAAFAIAIFSGLHLGLNPILSMNIGMTYIPNMILPLVMYAAVVLYLWSAFHLHKRYSANQNIFGE